MTFLFHTHLAFDYPQEIDSLASRHPDHVFLVARGRDQLFELITDADVLIDHRVSGELLSRASRLKWLFVPFTGVNSVPFDLLAPRGIRVSNNHGNASLVAERAVALALSLAGRVAEFDRGLRQGRWFRNESRDNPFQFWESVRGQNTLILGTGAIGRGIAALMRPFGCRIVGWRRRRGAPVPPGFDAVAGSLEEALEACDLCFVALPLTDATRNLIGRKELALLKGSRLINVARGPVIDEAAMYDSLVGRELAGAALDVWNRYPEPFYADRLPSEYPFHELDNVVLSPHAGSHAPEGKEGQLAGTIANIEALIRNGQPDDFADPVVGY